MCQKHIFVSQVSKRQLSQEVPGACLPRKNFCKFTLKYALFYCFLETLLRQIMFETCEVLSLLHLRKLLSASVFTRSPQRIRNYCHIIVAEYD